MIVSNDIHVPVCKNCEFWEPDRYNLHMACALIDIPCGNFHSCDNHVWHKASKNKLKSSYVEVKT